jgi:hypothetical protein
MREPCAGICGEPVVGLDIEFVARVAVTSIDSHYETNMRFTPTGPCRYAASPGLFGSTDRDLRSGELVQDRESLIACPGIVDGEVSYAANDGPSGGQTAPGLAGQATGALVGRFTVRIP